MVYLEQLGCEVMIVFTIMYIILLYGIGMYFSKHVMYLVTTAVSQRMACIN